jgi:hypothetical protein
MGVVWGYGEVVGMGSALKNGHLSLVISHWGGDGGMDVWMMG